MGKELDHFLDAVRRTEQGRRQAYDREAELGRGVAWSGFGPDAFTSRTEEAMAAEASRRLGALQSWRASRDGQLLRTVCEAQMAALAAYAAAESVRTALARAAPDPAPTRELSSRIAALLAAARQADAVMDAAAANALSGGACATNTASSSPSTASPSSSAS